MQLPPPPPGSNPTHAPDAHRSRRRLPHLSAAGWLATTGASLLLLASIVVVAGNWAAIGPEARFAGLVASLLAVHFAAEWLRDRVPLTAKALATLAPTLTAPVGIAAAATLAQPWPVCIVLGGLGSVISTEIQTRRWAQPALKATTVFAAGLAATGVAALAGIPVGLIGAGIAVLYAAVGAQRRSIVMSLAVALSPLVQLLGLWSIGDGTIARIGVSGADLVWSAPVSSAIAAGVIAVAAHRRQDMRLIAAATAALAAGLITSSIDSELAAPTLWALPAIALIATELIAALSPSTIWGEASRRASRIVTPPLVIAGVLSALLLLSSTPTDADAWVITIAANAAAIWVALAGSARRDAGDEELGPMFFGAVAATVALEIVIWDAQLWWSDVAMVTIFSIVAWLIGTGRGVRWRDSAAILLVGAATISTAVLELDASESSLVMLGVVVGLTAFAFGRSEPGPLDTGAIAASIVQLALAASAIPLIMSMSVTLVAAQWMMYLIARSELRLAALTATVSAAALVSTWWTSGTNELVITALHPYGADGVDLAIGVVSSLLVAIGHLIRQRLPVSSWLAFSPGLGMAVAWLLPAQLDTNGAWATVAGLSIGVLSVGVGGIRRLAAPLVIGTGLLVASVLISAGERLSTAPAWIWIASGGAGLLVLAGLIERTDRPLVVSQPHDDLTSLLDQFRTDFS